MLSIHTVRVQNTTLFADKNNWFKLPCMYYKFPQNAAPASFTN